MVEALPVGERCMPNLEWNLERVWRSLPGTKRFDIDPVREGRSLNRGCYSTVLGLGIIVPSDIKRICLEILLDTCPKPSIEEVYS